MIDEKDNLIARLEERHSQYKEELALEVYRSQYWFIRAFVAERYLLWYNAQASTTSAGPLWYEEDLKKEIRIQAKRLFELWKRGEPWREHFDQKQKK